MGPPSNSSPGPSSFPSEFGAYRLLGRLAQGRRGHVYFAVPSDGAQGRTSWLALKQLSPDFMDDREVSARWLLALERAAAVMHPQLCRVHRTGSFEGTPFCAMELCGGLDLERICDKLRARKVTLPIRCAAWIISQVAGALEVAHVHPGQGFTGIAHGDLTASNVLVGYDGRVKVINLGLALALEGGETGRGSDITAAEIDADVVSLGRCLAALLDRGAEEGSSAAMSRAPEAEVPGGALLRGIAARAIEPSADGRFTSAGAVQQSLDAFLAAHGVDFEPQTLGIWMTTTFQAELHASRIVERRILDAAALPVSAPPAAGASVRPRRVSIEEAKTSDDEVTVKPLPLAPSPKPKQVRHPISAPLPKTTRSVARSDPDKTPPQGVLAEQLAAAMWTDSEPTRVGPASWLQKPQMALEPELEVEIEEITKVPPQPVQPLPSQPLLSEKPAPLWAPSGSPQRRALSARVWLAVALVTGTFIALTPRFFERQDARTAPQPTAVPPVPLPAAQTEPIKPEAPPDSAPIAPVTSPSKRRRSNAVPLSATQRSSTGAGADTTPVGTPELPGGAGTQPSSAPSGPAGVERPQASRQPTSQGASTTAPTGPAGSAPAVAPPSQSPAVRAPVLVSRVPGRFPAQARERGVYAGSVELSFTIDRAGHVRDPVVIQSNPAGVFDEAALEAVSQWRYQPRLEAGAAVDSLDQHTRLEFSDSRE